VAWELAGIAIAAVIGTLGNSYFRGARERGARRPVHGGAAARRGASNTECFALSPDGSRLVFLAMRGGTRQLWIRRLESLEAQPPPDTEGAIETFFWSPDSRTLALKVHTKLKAIDVRGGFRANGGRVPEGAHVRRQLESRRPHDCRGRPAIWPVEDASR
jgi:hypothetical protein